MRRCLKEPIPEIFAAYRALSDAVDAHLSGSFDVAATRFKNADCPIVLEWLNATWANVTQHIVVMKPAFDTKLIPPRDRDPDRNIAMHVRNAVLERDGYRCRYCGLPVVHADIRKIAHSLYPDAVPWNPHDPKLKHAGFQALWLQFDHVEPHSHGGKSTVENVVIACALCNFGKDAHTLRQLDLEDPRIRPPVSSKFDGLERFRVAARSKARDASTKQDRDTNSAKESADTKLSSFFFSGAWISKGYVNIPPIESKSRWFKLGGSVSAEPAVRNNLAGCVVTCPPSHLERRGLDANAFRDKGPTS